MDIFAVVREYIDRMLPIDGSMKVLLLDEDTTRIISVAYSQTSLLQRGVFLVDQITNQDRRKMPTMRCVVFVRPSPASLSAVHNELEKKLYTSYTLTFSNVINTDHLDALARADKGELVVRVEESFADFIAVNSDLMLVPSRSNPLAPSMVSHDQLLRTAQSITAACVAMRRKPHIRFQRTSAYCKAISTAVGSIFRGDTELYDFKTGDSLLLIVDRSDDPITPLLIPWTYQAMLHELVGMENNRLELENSSSGTKDEYVFSQQDDPFFANNMFKNWGDLCSNVKDYVDHCKAALNIDRSTASIEEVKQFMQKLPQTKQMTGSVTKHATVVAYLSDILKGRNLLDISLLEQHMVATKSESEHFDRLVELSKAPTTKPHDLLRLCLIYNLRYEKANTTSKTEQLLIGSGRVQLLRKLREYYGDRSTEQLFASTSVMASVISFVKGLSDVGNIYTQHVPVLRKHLQAVSQNKLDLDLYPYVANTVVPPAFRPKEIFLFVAGGITFEEAAMINQLNASAGSESSTLATGTRVVLGSTGVHNTTTFLNTLDMHP